MLNLSFIVVFIITFIAIYGIGKILNYIVIRSGGIVDGTGVIFYGGLRAIQYIIMLGICTTIISYVPLLSFFWFVPFLILLYYCLFALPLLLGPFAAFIVGFAGNEILGIMPEFMLKYYHNNTPFSMEPMADYLYRRSDVKPSIFLIHEAWENERFLKDVDKWCEGDLERKPYYGDYVEINE